MHRARNEFPRENPKRAVAVRRTLIAVTGPVPSFRFILSESKLDMIVPAEIIIEIIPAIERVAEKSFDIIGHAEPSKESGSPRLIKEI